MPLGANHSSDEINFAVLSRHATSVHLVILPESGGTKPLAEIELDPRRNRTGDHWHIRVHELPNVFCYGWRVDGPHGTRTRFDSTRLLLDPAAAPARLTGDHDRLEREGEDFRARVDAGYRDLAARFPERIVSLDGTLPAEELAEEVYGALRVRS